MYRHVTLTYLSIIQVRGPAMVRSSTVATGSQMLTPCSQDPVLYPRDRLVWCTLPEQHGLIFCPEFQYGPSLAYGGDSWAKAAEGRACAEQKREIFYEHDGFVHYAGTYICHSGPSSQKVSSLGGWMTEVCSYTAHNLPVSADLSADPHPSSRARDAERKTHQEEDPQAGACDDRAAISRGRAHRARSRDRARRLQQRAFQQACKAIQEVVLRCSRPSPLRIIQPVSGAGVRSPSPCIRPPDGGLQTSGTSIHSYSCPICTCSYPVCPCSSSRSQRPPPCARPRARPTGFPKPSSQLYGQLLPVGDLKTVPGGRQCGTFASREDPPHSHSSLR